MVRPSSHKNLHHISIGSYLELTVEHTHTHTRLTALCPGLPRWAGTRKEKPVWILLKQQIVSGSGISWTICKSTSRSRQITMPAPHHSVFLQAGCPSCRPTNSVKALKAELWLTNCRIWERIVLLRFSWRLVTKRWLMMNVSLDMCWHL